MKKSFNVDSTFNDMRIDRWIKNSLGKIPQGLIEKNLRAGKIFFQIMNFIHTGNLQD